MLTDTMYKAACKIILFSIRKIVNGIASAHLSTSIAPPISAMRYKLNRAKSGVSHMHPVNARISQRNEAGSDSNL